MPQQGTAPGRAQKSRKALWTSRLIFLVFDYQSVNSYTAPVPSICKASIAAKHECKATLVTAAIAMAPSHCGYVGCLFMHCMSFNFCPRATAKLANTNGLYKPRLKSPSISATKLHHRTAAYLRNESIIFIRNHPKRAGSFRMVTPV